MRAHEIIDSLVVRYNAASLVGRTITRAFEDRYYGLLLQFDDGSVSHVTADSLGEDFAQLSLEVDITAPIARKMELITAEEFAEYVAAEEARRDRESEAAALRKYEELKKRFGGE